MTIKEFAKLCSCNPQTLRYYDHVNLLKPAKVDEWSNYRFYEEEQATDFVKIKNLQRAGFKIDEIRQLLKMDNTAIYRAFDRKISEAIEKLREIENIQRSYLSEMEQIKEKIREVKEKIAQLMQNFDAEKEFGLAQNEYANIAGAVRKTMENFDIDNEEKLAEIEKLQIQQKEDYFNGAHYELIYEKHGWTFAKDFLSEILDLENGKEHVLLVRNMHNDEHNMAFANTLLGILIEKNKGKSLNLKCDFEKSADMQNHFYLFKKK